MVLKPSRFIRWTVALVGTELLTCVLKNTVALMAAIIDSLLEEFGETLRENTKFTVKQNVFFRDLILKTIDFDKLVLIYWDANLIDYK